MFLKICWIVSATRYTLLKYWPLHHTCQFFTRAYCCFYCYYWLSSRPDGRTGSSDPAALDPWTLPYRSLYLQNWTNFQRFSEDNSSNFEGTGCSDICALVVKLGTCSAACIAINWLCTAWWLPVHPPQDLSWRSSRCTQNKTKPTDFINLSLSADSACLKFLTVSRVFYNVINQYSF